MDKMKLHTNFEINEKLDIEDTRFLNITIDVLHTGMNLNGSVFNKSVVERNADSIKNTPVLGFIAYNGDGDLDFLGHEYKWFDDGNGKKWIYGGNAYGVIPESCNYRWVKKMCSDGEEREFFQVDALLWTKFEDALSIFGDGKPQSMELEISSIEGEYMENGTFVFTDFKFDGCCLLSSTDEWIEPAMIDSKAILKYSIDNIVTEIRDNLNKYYSLQKQEEFKGDNMEQGKMPNEDTLEVNSNANSEFSLSAKEKWEEFDKTLRAAGGKYEEESEWIVDRFHLIDILEDEVIFEDEEDECRLYGAPYIIEKDEVFISLEEKKRKKIAYIDFDEETEIDISDNFVIIHKDDLKDMNSKVKEFKEKYTSLKEEYDEIKPKYDIYVEREEKRQKDYISAQKESIFEKFEKYLKNDEEFMALKENKNEYDLETIESKCAVLFTEKTLKESDFSKINGHIMTTGVVEENYDYVENLRYGTLKTK